ncbi:MAG: MFS transporter [Candidatus Aminicenantia bacterium]
MTAQLEHVGAFHPTRTLYRFSILFFVALLTYGSYFAYDSLGAISPLLIEILGIGREQIGTTYSAYSIAAIFSVLLGGLLIDRIGTRRASLLFSMLVVLGAVIVALANNIYMIYIGRVIFGMGSESLIVCQSSILARWFKGKELALAFGVALTLSRLGTIFSFNVEASIASHFNSYRAALWAAVIFCVLSLFSNLVYIVMDRHGERFLRLKEAGAGDKIRIRDIKDFRPSYWFVVLLCITFYSAIFPFTSLSTDFFHTKWNIPLTLQAAAGGIFGQIRNFFGGIFTTAGGITSIIMIASAVLAPIFGRMVDRVGRRSSIMVFGSLLMIPTFLVMAFTHIYPAWPMIMLGLAFSLVPAAMWPAVPLIVKEERVGTAFGLMTMIQNIGLMTFPYLNGKLRDVTQEYTASMVMFAVLGILGLVFALLLKRADVREGGHLERPGMDSQR